MGAAPLGLCRKPMGCIGLCSMLGGVWGSFSSVVGGLVSCCGQMYVLIVFMTILRVGLVGQAVGDP